MANNGSEIKYKDTDEMATSKVTENDVSKRVERSIESNNTSRRVMKFKVSEYVENLQKKQTRAKTRTAGPDDTAHTQGSTSKARDKTKCTGDMLKDDVPVRKDMDISKWDGDLTKKDVGFAVPKKDTVRTGAITKDILATVSVNKDIDFEQPKMDEDIDSLKDPQFLEEKRTPKKDLETIPVKSRKFKIKNSSNAGEKKRDERLNPSKTEETKSDVTSSEKSKSKDDKYKNEKKELTTSSKLDDENKEIMNSDITSSVNEKPRSKAVRYQKSPLLGKTKVAGWSPGDLAWARIGNHPFWPCMITVDKETGVFTKITKVIRSMNAVQYSLHVSFFGDNGRHSWIHTSSVIKFEGVDSFKEKFRQMSESNNVRKKDRKYFKAFSVKFYAQRKWDVAIEEANEYVSKGREDRVKHFQRLLPKIRRAAKTARVAARAAARAAGGKNKNAQKNGINKNAQNDVKIEDDKPKTEDDKPKSSVQLVKKRNKRPNPSTDEKPAKQVKLDKELTLKAVEGIKTADGVPSRQKRGRDKTAKNQTGIAGK